MEFTYVSIAEYAKAHERNPASVRQGCIRGQFSTATKIGRDWFIDPEEPYPDARVKTGSYIGQSRKYRELRKAKQEEEYNIKSED